jgi:RNA polymerase sigma-70 factor, ECF subfamily
MDTINVNSDGLSAASFGELYQRYGPDVYRYAFYLSGNAAIAEDIASETFLRIWTSERPVHLASVKAYLLAIARNLYLHELRGRGRIVELDLEALPDSSFTPALESRADLRAVLNELQQWPEASRSALLLRAVDGLPYEEIAAMLNISVSSAKVKVHRARQRLAERLKRSPLQL